VSAPRKVSFGVFELDVASGELRKGGTRVRLQEQPFQVLKALVEKPGEVVTREELQQRLWPGDTFVDFEDGLSTAVKKIRRALGDSAANPRFVETLPKRGYRFVAPVAGLDGTDRVVADRAGEGGRRRPWVRIVPWVLAAVTTLALLATLTARRSADESGVAGTQEPVPFTTYPGSELHPTFSPDGGRVAFQWCNEGQCDLYIKLVGSESRQRLTDHPGEEGHPAWSPDGKQIAFYRYHEGEGSLNLIPAIGGVERELVKEKGFKWRGIHSWEPKVAWHPNGKWIVWANRESNWRSLQAVSVATRETFPVTTPAADTLGDGCVTFSPNGRELLFCRILNYVSTDLYRLRVNDEPFEFGTPERLPVAQRFMTGIAVLPSGQEIVGIPRPNARLAKLELKADALARSLGIGRGANAVAYSRTGKRLVYAVRQWDANVWQMDLSNGETSSPERLIAETASDHQAAYSPNGSRMAFWSNRSGNPEVWVADANGSNKIQLTHLNGRGGVSWPSWSPDGSHILFGLNQNRGSNMYSISVSGGREEKVFDHPEWVERGVYSADMQTLFFSRRTAGRTDCYQMAAGGGEQILLVEGVGIYCEPSPDGAYLYYSSESQQGLWRKHLESGETTHLAPALSAVGAFTVWRDGVYYLSAPAENGLVGLYSLNRESGARSRLAELEDRHLYCLSAPADGSRVLWSQRDTMGADLMLVEGFE
jgi:Tol biopolymer transport system component/DNA-binding winged helix-turn-helix (wHTH) protein